MPVEVAAVVPPPYSPPATAGLVTVTDTVPDAAMPAAGIVAVSWLDVTNVVVWAVPFQSMAASLAKLVPFTVKTNAAPPAVALAGANELMVGAVPGCAGV